ncbi:hypothetical protein D6745_03245 [Candidatus Woesearchaeota archaeon]|nr:MAG: hypothetical protein D6745_03245 [Candidatus Woesearchaeota archaeon]
MVESNKSILTKVEWWSLAGAYGTGIMSILFLITWLRYMSSGLFSPFTPALVAIGIGLSVLLFGIAYEIKKVLRTL